MASRKIVKIELSPAKTRLGGIGIILIALAIGSITLITYIYYLYPMFDRMYRNAAIVETPYMAFGLLAAPPLVVLTLIIGATCLWTGKKFDPPPRSKLDALQILMLKTGVRTLIFATPTAVLLTTITLHFKGYTTCSKLRISNSNWHVYWVDSERFCFVPDAFTDDNWPCKNVGSRSVCLRGN